MDKTQLLFALLRIAVCGEPVTDDIKTSCTPELLEQVYALAGHHDLAHLVGQAVSKLELPESEAVTKCKQAAMQAFARYMRQSHAYEQTCAALEEAQIPFIPLKGSVLREHYPEPWMRTSCDMDILVKEKELEKATRVLEEKLSYSYQGKTSHDVSMITPGGVQLELHYSTIEDYVSESAERILSGIWEKAVPLKGKNYHTVMPDTLFYYYHIAHMAKHFVHGGCGIRPFLDLWILDEKGICDAVGREDLLAQGELLTFTQAARKLSRVWFSGEDYDSLSKQMEGFILSGGTYGTMENYVTVHQAQKGNKLRYLLSRVFLSYDVIKYYYPILQRHKWLTPIYQVVRWFKIAFCGGADHAIKELQTNAATSDTQIHSTAKLLKHLGL